MREGKVDNIWKYLLYALGEILLIILGILIAVNINEKQTIRKNNVIRCQYLQELIFALEQDKIDVLDNLNAFNKWNPKLKEVLVAIDSSKLHIIDSVNHKITVLSNYVTFLQQSKGKIEELKYSDINLITNRELKNQILLYQETKIKFLLEHQRRFNQVNDKVEEYFLQKKVFSINDLQNDDYFYQLAKMKYNKHKTMVYHYDILLKELLEIYELTKAELQQNCLKHSNEKTK